MNLEEEIRLAKLQIMWSIAVSMCGVYLIMRMPDMGVLWDLFFAALLIVVWYLGVWDLRKHIESEIEKE